MAHCKTLRLINIVLGNRGVPDPQCMQSNSLFVGFWGYFVAYFSGGNILFAGFRRLYYLLVGGNSLLRVSGKYITYFSGVLEYRLEVKVWAHRLGLVVKVCLLSTA